MIESDKHVQKTLKTIAARKRMPVNKLLDEVFALHEQRPKTRVFAKLAKDQLNTSALRHRIAAIKMEMLREKVDLERVQSALDDYIRAKYQNFLDRHNVKTQNAIINSALDEVVSRVERLKGAIEVVDVCLEDYDKASWTFKGVNDSLSLGDRV